MNTSYYYYYYYFVCFILCVSLIRLWTKVLPHLRLESSLE